MTSDDRGRRRWSGIFRRPPGGEVDEELAFHLDERIDSRRRHFKGASPVYRAPCGAVMGRTRVLQLRGISG
jgi:hypothetical protein